MTKVAPCTFCAGPNTAPRNECAIMIWSETSTAYTENSFSFGGGRIADQLPDRVAIGAEHRRQLRRQVRKRDGRRDQPVEHGIPEQRERGRQPPAMGPARAVRRRDLADLARDDPQAAAVEGFAERRGDVAFAIPAELDDGRLLAGKAQRGR